VALVESQLALAALASLCSGERTRFRCCGGCCGGCDRALVSGIHSRRWSRSPRSHGHRARVRVSMDELGTAGGCACGRRRKRQP